MKTRTNRLKLTGLACVFGLLVGAAPVVAGEAEQAADRTLMKLLAAVQTNDYDSFVADGNEAFKAGITRQMLQGVSSLLSPRMKKGYTPTYLGQLKQQGCQVHLWKLVFKDGGDDTLLAKQMHQRRI